MAQEVLFGENPTRVVRVRVKHVSMEDLFSLSHLLRNNKQWFPLHQKVLGVCRQKKKKLYHLLQIYLHLTDDCSFFLCRSQLFMC